MDIQSETRDNATIFNLSGVVDAVTCSELEAVLLPAAAEGENGHIVINFAEVPYMSSAGLRVIMMTWKAAKPIGTRVSLAAASPALMEIFDITGFGKIFQIFDTVDQALVQP